MTVYAEIWNYSSASNHVALYGKRGGGGTSSSGDVPDFMIKSMDEVL